MSLVLLSEGWKQFGEGRRWRCVAPLWYCEVDREKNVPSFMNLAPSVNVVKRVRAYYQSKSFTALADEHGNIADILTANAMTESYGTVPCPFSREELERVLKGSKQTDQRLALAEVADYIVANGKFLIRKEPGYSDPVSTPGKISVGAHHILLSTAIETLNLPAGSEKTKIDSVTRLIIGLASDPVFSAELALGYFHRRYARHQLEPPLMAAIYNAGSLRPNAKSPWNLAQYGEHVDRWVAFYNTSRSIAQGQPVRVAASDKPGTPPALELTVIRKEFTERSTIGELQVDGAFHCFTLEDKVRPDGVKIYGETAIPHGRYEVQISFSNHFQKEMPILLNVPNFEGVRIHGGNKPEDTLGCILVGRLKGSDRISDCKPVLDTLLDKIKKAVPDKKCFITLKNQ